MSQAWLQSLDELNQEIPSFSDLLEGRTNRAYTVVYQRFLPCVVGKQLWETRMKEGNDDIGLCTVSDEAYVLLALENSWDRWIDIFKKNGKQVFYQRGLKSKEWVSDVPPLYTSGGIVFKDPTKRPKNKGWSTKGIERYNELHKDVKLDRLHNPSFGIKWIETMKALQEKKTARTPPQPQQDIVIPVNELFLDDPIGSSKRVVELDDHHYATEDVEDDELIRSASKITGV